MHFMGKNLMSMLGALLAAECVVVLFWVWAWSVDFAPLSWLFD